MTETPIMVTVLLDRDGTIVEDTGYLRSPSQVTLLPGAGAALNRLQTAGARLAVVSNQSGVGRGIISAAEADSVHSRVVELLTQFDVEITRWYYCRHAPADKCRCRKPRPLMLRSARAEVCRFDDVVYMVGDSRRDVAAGKAADCRTILLSNTLIANEFGADHVVPDLGAAADLILWSRT